MFLLPLRLPLLLVAQRGHGTYHEETQDMIRKVVEAVVKGRVEHASLTARLYRFHEVAPSPNCTHLLGGLEQRALWRWCAHE